MKTGSIAIIDYQMGNLRSVQKAVEHVGGTVFVSDDPAEILNADKVILPGVGAFGDAMTELRKRDLCEPIIEFAKSGRPFLGICLGAQLLLESGEEGGAQTGLGLIAGTVPRFQLDGLKVPHMGWNTVGSCLADDPLMVGLPTEPYFYFVHSFYCRPTDPSAVWMECEYGQKFCAAIRHENVYATQFHPEKSQANGLRLLQNFVNL